MGLYWWLVFNKKKPIQFKYNYNYNFPMLMLYELRRCENKISLSENFFGLTLYICQGGLTRAELHYSQRSVQFEKYSWLLQYYKIVTIEYMNHEPPFPILQRYPPFKFPTNIIMVHHIVSDWSNKQGLSYASYAK